MQKKGLKKKINTKVAEVATDKVEKKSKSSTKDGKDEIRLNKYISIQGLLSS
jgi:23S rRNA pseudouridine2605 synthase